jgi:hypothetical protein
MPRLVRGAGRLLIDGGKVSKLVTAWRGAQTRKCATPRYDVAASYSAHWRSRRPSQAVAIHRNPASRLESEATECASSALLRDCEERLCVVLRRDVQGEVELMEQPLGFCLVWGCAAYNARGCQRRASSASRASHPKLPVISLRDCPARTCCALFPSLINALNTHFAIKVPRL